MENIELKIVASFIIAAGLYASALNGLNQQLNEAGYVSAQSQSQAQENQKQINTLIKEMTESLK